MPVTFGTVEVMPAVDAPSTASSDGGRGAATPRPIDAAELEAAARRMAARAARVRAH